MSTPTFRSDVLAAKAEAAGDTTHYAIAVRAGVRESTISRLLGGRTVPSVPTLVALATVYGTTLDDLVQWKKPAPAGAIPEQRTEEAAA